MIACGGCGVFFAVGPKRNSLDMMGYRSLCGDCYQDDDKFNQVKAHNLALNKKKRNDALELQQAKLAIAKRKQEMRRK